MAQQANPGQSMRPTGTSPRPLAQLGSSLDCPAATAPGRPLGSGALPPRIGTRSPGSLFRRFIGSLFLVGLGISRSPRRLPSLQPKAGGQGDPALAPAAQSPVWAKTSATGPGTVPPRHSIRASRSGTPSAGIAQVFAKSSYY